MYATKLCETYIHTHWRRLRERERERERENLPRMCGELWLLVTHVE